MQDGDSFSHGVKSCKDLKVEQRLNFFRKSIGRGFAAVRIQVWDVLCFVDSEY